MSRINRKSYVNIPQMIIDALCMFLTYVMSVLFIGKIFHTISPSEYLWIPVLFGMVYIFMMYFYEMYNRSTFTYQDRTLRYVLKACIMAAVFCLVMMPFASKTDNYGLDFLMVYLLTALVVICIQYLIVQEIRLAHNSRWKKRAVLVGARENIQEYLYYIRKTSFQVDVVDYVTLDKDERINQKDNVEELQSFLKKNVVDEVIFALPCQELEGIRPMISKCQERGLTVRVTMDFFEGNESKSTVHTVGTIPVITWQASGLNDFQSFIKRLMDIIGSLLGLCIFILTSFIIIPLVKVMTKGPVFVKNAYISLNGRPFTLYWYNTSTDKGSKDPDTLVGKFLRRTGMDHLPMFWNVLKGDMSLVGSLPAPAIDLDLLTNDQFKNFCIRPGLTGTWRFADDNKVDDVDFLTEINLCYVKNWTLLQDIWLLVKTIIVVIAKRSGLCLFERLEVRHDAEIRYNL